jgi:hypothetical protein
MVTPAPIPFFIMVGLYLLSMAFIGIYAAKKTTNLREFFVMNAKAGAILSGLAYFSTQYSMSTFMGVPGTCYKVGYAGLAVSVPGLVFSMIIPRPVRGTEAHCVRKKAQIPHHGGLPWRPVRFAGDPGAPGPHDALFPDTLDGCANHRGGCNRERIHRSALLGRGRSHGCHRDFLLHERGNPGGHFDGRRSGNPHGGYGYRDFHSIRCHGRRILCHQRENRIGQPGTAYLPR